MSVQPRRNRIVASITAASLALVTVASVAVAAGPNLAGGSNGSCASETCPNDGQAAAGLQGRSDSNTVAAGSMGRRNRVPSGTLTNDQRAMVAYMAEEEKLAHDLYVVLGSKLGGRVLPAIAESEARHLAAVRSLMTTYGIKDPTAGLADGVFSSSEFRGLYASLLAKGSTSLATAYGVGEIVELDDIAELGQATAGVTAQNVLRVYANLLRGSERHLAAFRAQ
jgi:hypothetical protein